MPALNHIIIPAKDKDTSASFLADILGVEVQPQAAPKPAQLPATGSSDAVPLAAIGIAVIMSGALLVAVRRFGHSS